MNKRKFYLMKAISHEKTNIYRYNSKEYTNMFMWRETEEEARADFYRFFLNKQDTAKGLNEMNEIDEIKKYNYELIIS